MRERQKEVQDLLGEAGAEADRALADAARGPSRRRLVVEEAARRVVAQREAVDPAVVAVGLVARDAFGRRPLQLLRAVDPNAPEQNAFL